MVGELHLYRHLGLRKVVHHGSVVDGPAPDLAAERGKRRLP